MENAYMLLVSVSSEYSVLSKTAIATGVKTRGFGNPLGSDFVATSNPHIICKTGVGATQGRITPHSREQRHQVFDRYSKFL